MGVHFGGGLTGLIAAPLFTQDGLVFGINEGSVQVSITFTFLKINFYVSPSICGHLLGQTQAYGSFGKSISPSFENVRFCMLFEQR